MSNPDRERRAVPHPIYVTTVRNLGDKPAERVVVDNPMPERMLYRGASITDDQGAVEVSVDGGKR